MDLNKCILLCLQQPGEDRGVTASWTKQRRRGLNLATGSGEVRTFRVEVLWRVLTAGQAADFTVLCAGLVHEGAVEAGPHG